MTASAQSRYTRVAIAMHWLIALALLIQIRVGFWMTGAIDDSATRMAAYQAFQLHKSLGLTILLASLARLVWRLVHKPPPLPAAMPAWEKHAARATHWAFYAIMIGAPLTGWAYVSAGWNIQTDKPFSVPTIWFDLIPAPDLPGLKTLPDAARKSAAEAAAQTHAIVAWIALGLLALHVLAALKHHLFDRDDVLTRMAPVLKPLARKEAPK